MNVSQYMPICLSVKGRDCLVVGGGKVALRKITVLRKFGAHVTCISPKFDGSIERLRNEKKVKCVRQVYPVKAALKKYTLVVAATDSPAVNRRVARDAGRDKVLVNVVDDSIPGTFIMPAILKRKGLVLGVSTGGKDPARAKKIRDTLKNAL